MATMGRRVGRLDVRLIRGDSERLGARWRRRYVDSGEIRPVDLSAWSGRVELWSPDNFERWYSTACGEMTADGFAVAYIPPSAFADDVWRQRRHGQWKVVVSSPGGGVVRTLAWGYFTLSD